LAGHLLLTEVSFSAASLLMVFGKMRNRTVIGGLPHRYATMIAQRQIVRQAAFQEQGGD
jgi:hypothetical protein